MSRLSDVRRPLRSIALLLVVSSAVFGCEGPTAPPPKVAVAGTLTYDVAPTTARLVVTAVHATQLTCTGDLAGTGAGSGTDTLRLTVTHVQPIAVDSAVLVTQCVARGRAAGDSASLGLRVVVPANVPPSLTAVVADSTSYVDQSQGVLTWSASGGGPGNEPVTCTATSLGDPLTVTQTGGAWRATFTVRADRQAIVLGCDDGRGLPNSVVGDTVVLTTYRRFQDLGTVTRIAGLGLELLDVYALASMTHAEVEAAVAAMGEGWTFATLADVRRIFEYTTAAEYEATVRHLIGFSPLTVNDTTYFNTAGRVSNVYAEVPDYRWLGGFGTGIQQYNHDLGRAEYFWNAFDIGAQEYKEGRFASFGAWVIRPFAR